MAITRKSSCSPVVGSAIVPLGIKNEPQRQMYWYILFQVSAREKWRREKLMRVPTVNQSVKSVEMLAAAL